MYAPHCGHDRRVHATLLISIVLVFLGNPLGADTASLPVEQIRRSSTDRQSIDHLTAGWYALSLAVAPTQPIIDCSDGATDGDAVNVSGTATPAGVVTPLTATIEVLAVATLNVPEAHPVRTTSRLTVPPGAQWQSVMAGDSLALSLETGSIRVDLHDGRARIARGIDSSPCMTDRDLADLASGEEATLRAGDRMILHGDSALMVHGVGDMTAIGTVVRITTP